MRRLPYLPRKAPISALMTAFKNIWTERFGVRTYERDPTGRASFLSMCNYFQEAAGNHARSYGVSVEDLLAAERTWVLSRLHIQIDAYPAWGDEVVVETWPSGVQGLFAVRELQFHLGGAVIGRGTSAWLIIDLARRRPLRVEQILRHVTPPARPRALDDDFGKLPLPAGAGHERRFHVRYSDLDVNQHVNHVRYAEWAVESVPEATLHEATLAGLEIQFRAEATFGDLVIAQAHPNAAGTTFGHQLLRAEDGATLAVARTRWRASGEGERG